VPTDPNQIDPLRLSHEHLADLIGVAESQHVDFKRSAPKSEDDRREFLRDIVAMTNGGGGYLIYGAEEVNEVCKVLRNIDDADGIVQTFNQSILDGVSERIGGVIIKKHSVNGTDIITVFLPPESPNRPHMVIKDKKTEFYCRYGKDKRTMTVAEIRQLFMSDSVSRRIDSIQERLGRLVEFQQRQQETDAQRLQATASDRYHEVTLGDVLRRGLRERFHRRCASDSRKLFRISITPEEPRIVMNSANEAPIISLCESPPDQRRGGWNVGGIRDHQRRVGAIVFGVNGYYELTIWENGAIEFVNDISHLAWAVDRYGVAGHDYIHPHPLIEYLVSFCRLAKQCYSILNVHGAVTLEYEANTRRSRSIDNHLILRALSACP
jgi:hypothetical protein